MEVGIKIKRIRELKNIPMKEIAEKLDMSVPGYSKIERGEVSITIDKLNLIATAMEVKPEDIMSFDEKIIFKDNVTLTSCAFNYGQVNNNFPEKLHQLYEDKIKLLEDTIGMLKEEIKRLKGDR